MVWLSKICKNKYVLHDFLFCFFSKNTFLQYPLSLRVYLYVTLYTTLYFGERLIWGRKWPDSRNAHRICASVLLPLLPDMCSTLLPLFQVAQWRPSEGNFGTWRRREAPPSGRQAFCQFFARNSQAGTNLPLPRSVRRHLPCVWRHMPDSRSSRHLDFGTNWEDSVVSVIASVSAKEGIHHKFLWIETTPFI